MDIEKMTEALQAIILAAMTKAQECNHVEIAPEHVLLAMLDDNGLDGIWSRLNCDKQKMIAFVEGYLNRLAVVPDSDGQPIINRYVIEAYSKGLKRMKRNPAILT